MSTVHRSFDCAGFAYLTLRYVDCGLVYNAQATGYVLRSARSPGEPRYPDFRTATTGSMTRKSPERWNHGVF